jgi:hypothetical protein
MTKSKSLSRKEIWGIYQFLSPFDIITIRYINRAFYIASILDESTNPSSEDLIQVFNAIIEGDASFGTVQERIPELFQKNSDSSLLAKFPEICRQFEPISPKIPDNLFTLGWMKHCFVQYGLKNSIGLRKTNSLKDHSFLQVRDVISTRIQTTHDLLINMAGNGMGNLEALAPLQNEIVKGFVDQTTSDLKPFHGVMRKPLYLLSKLFAKGSWGATTSVEITRQVFEDMDAFGAYLTSRKCIIEELHINLASQFRKESQTEWLCDLIKKNTSLKKVIISLETNQSTSQALPMICEALHAQNLIQELCIHGAYQIQGDTIYTVLVPSSCKILRTEIAPYNSANSMRFHPGLNLNGRHDFNFKNIGNLVEIISEGFPINAELSTVLESPNCKLKTLQFDTTRTKIFASDKTSWLQILSKNTSLTTIILNIAKDTSERNMFGTPSGIVSDGFKMGLLKNPNRAKEFFTSLPKSLTKLSMHLESNFLIYNILMSLSSYLSSNKINFGLSIGSSFAERITESSSSFGWGSSTMNDDTSSSLEIKAKIIKEVFQSVKSCDFIEFSFASHVTQNFGIFSKHLTGFGWKMLRCDKMKFNITNCDKTTMLAIIKEIQSPIVEFTGIVHNVIPQRFGNGPSQPSATFFEVCCANAVKNKNLKNLIFQLPDRINLQVITGMSYLVGSGVALNGQEVTDEKILQAYAPMTAI